MRILLALLLVVHTLLAQSIPEVEALNAQIVELNKQGRYGDAIPKAERVLAIIEKHRGPYHLDTALSLSILADLYEKEGAYDKAGSLYQRALVIREKTLGPDHLDTAATLDSLAGVYQDQEEYGKAEPLYQRALAIRKKLLGEDHPDTATSLSNLAELYKEQGDYNKAQPLYESALKIQQKALRPDHPDIGATLNNLADFYRERGSYSRAEPLYQHALTIFKKAYGPGHPNTATVLNNLGTLYVDEGAYAKAQPLLQRALGIREKLLGADNRDTQISLSTLAELYKNRGEYAKAEPLFKRVLVSREKTLGRSHSDTAASLNNLADVYVLEGAYSKAESLYQDALTIWEKVKGPNHLYTATVVNNLAELYEEKGAYTKAESLFQRALAIWEEVRGSNHPYTATSLHNLGELYVSEGDYAKAEPLYRRSLAIREETLGPDHPQTATSLRALAKLYTYEGFLTKAEPLFQRALAIATKSLGPNAPQTAASLNDLAQLYVSERKYAKAEPLYRRALATAKKSLGPNHVQVAAGLNNLAMLYASEGAYKKAEPLYRRSITIATRALGPNHPDTLAKKRNLAILHCEMGDWAKAAVELKFLLDNERERSDLAFGRDSQRQQVSQVRESLIAALHAGSSLRAFRGIYLPLLLEVILSSKARITDEFHASLEALKQNASEEDRRLVDELTDTERMIGMAAQRGPGNQQISEFRQQLQALIAKESDLNAKIAARSAGFRKVRADLTPAKLASELRNRVLIEIVRTAQFHPAPNRTFGEPLYTVLALFPDGHIKMADLGAAKLIDDLITAYRQAQEVIDNREQADALAARLGNLILAPIAKMAGQHHNEWYVAADGDIRILPLNALLVNGKYVAEDYKIWSIGSGRDLLTFNSRVESGGDDLILANPDFGDGTDFVPLQESEEEAAAIAEVLPNAQIVQPENRSKSFLLNLTTDPRILHLSTHAFYHAGFGDPTLRSGIALNGANRGPEGILTAKEAQTLRLRGTQLLVMSACDTGLGEVSFGEGIVGLQRSLVLAGAHTQMLTQWSVNSVGTRDFMVRFYGKLAAGKTKGDAWLETQRDLIRAGMAPHLWAPFVLYGDPGPLMHR